MARLSPGLAGRHQPLPPVIQMSSTTPAALSFLKIDKTKCAAMGGPLVSQLSAKHAPRVSCAAGIKFTFAMLPARGSFSTAEHMVGSPVSKLLASRSFSHTSLSSPEQSKSVLRKGSRPGILCLAAEPGEGAEAASASGGLAVEARKTVVLGIDFGGSGIKGAPVDISTGQLLRERVRVPTPIPATPEAVAQVVKQLTDAFEWKGSIGVGMPSVVRRGLVRSAANIDKSWININARALFEAATGCQVAVLNDADAAGYAEIAFGAGQEYCQAGVVLMTTFGTGIGTAMFVDGNLVPNLELGHIEVEGEVAEKRASDRAREREELSWKKWAARVNQVLARYEHYLQPDIIIIGGGVSKKDEKFLHLLSVPGGTPIMAASMRNDAGIIGAAIGGARMLQMGDVLHRGNHPKNGEANRALAVSDSEGSPALDAPTKAGMPQKEIGVLGKKVPQVRGSEWKTAQELGTQNRAGNCAGNCAADVVDSVAEATRGKRTSARQVATKDSTVPVTPDWPSNWALESNGTHPWAL